MKLMIRTFGLTITGFMICLMLVGQMISYLEADKLDMAAREAMNSTQILMQENIEDRYYRTDNARISIDSDDKYISLYSNNLKKCSDKNYVIDDYYADSRLGIIYVKVSHTYKVFGNIEKTITKKLINIIDVLV